MCDACRTPGGTLNWGRLAVNHPDLHAKLEGMMDEIRAAQHVLRIRVTMEYESSDGVGLTSSGCAEMSLPGAMLASLDARQVLDVAYARAGKELHTIQHEIPANVDERRPA